jgi:hypothetical protein
MSGNIEVHTETHTLSPDKDSISFVAYLDGRKVDCIITGEALKMLPSSSREISDSFTENQMTIGAIAESLMKANYQHIDGELLIGVDDIH